LRSDGKKIYGDVERSWEGEGGRVITTAATGEELVFVGEVEE